MRRSPTAYKYERENSKGFHEYMRTYKPNRNAAIAVKTVKAFGLKLVERKDFDHAYISPSQGGRWVLYSPADLGSYLLIHDDPVALASFAAASLHQGT